jgi:hypothetical protein
MKITKAQNGNVLITKSNGEKYGLDPSLDPNWKPGTLKVIMRDESQSIVHSFDVTEVTEVEDAEGTVTPIGNDAAAASQLFDLLFTDFFFDNGDGGEFGAGTGLTQPQLAFYELFTGDGFSNTFQLDGTIENGTFDQGTWDASNVLILYPTELVRDDTLNPTYPNAYVPGVLQNRIQVASINASGLVTLTAPVRAGIDFRIYYWYQPTSADRIADFVWEDIVSKSEADTTALQLEITDLRNLIDVQSQLIKVTASASVALLDGTFTAIPLDTAALPLPTGVAIVGNRLQFSFDARLTVYHKVPAQGTDGDRANTESRVTLNGSPINDSIGYAYHRSVQNDEGDAQDYTAVDITSGDLIGIEATIYGDNVVTYANRAKVIIERKS